MINQENLFPSARTLLARQGPVRMELVSRGDDLHRAATDFSNGVYRQKGDFTGLPIPDTLLVMHQDGEVSACIGAIHSESPDDFEYFDLCGTCAPGAALLTLVENGLAVELVRLSAARFERATNELVGTLSLYLSQRGRTHILGIPTKGVLPILRRLSPEIDDHGPANVSHLAKGNLNHQKHSTAPQLDYRCISFGTAAFAQAYLASPMRRFTPEPFLFGR